MTPETIAIIKPCCIGDAVMALPAIAAVAKELPDSRLVVMTGSHNRAIFEAHPAVDAIEPIPDIPGRHAIVPLLRAFRHVAPDWTIVLDRSRLLRTLAHASGADRIVAVAPGGQEHSFRHESDVYLEAVRNLGLNPVASTPELLLPDEEQSIARQALSDVRHPFIAMQPGGALNPGSVMVEKRWPVESFIAVAHWALEHDYSVVLTGAESDRSRCEQIAKALDSSRVHIMAGETSLMCSAAVIAEAALYIGGDTGLSHIAAAVGTSTIAIFGPTNPLRYAPRGGRVRIVAPPASFRLPDRDLRKPAPIPPEARCDLVTADEVISACRALLKKTTVIG